MRALRVTFVVAVICALGVFVWQARVEMGAAITRLSLPALLLSAIAAGGFTLTSCAAWRVLLRRNGRTMDPTQAARIYFLGQLGKYIPGGFWQFLAAAEMGRNAGFTRLQITASLLFALTASLTAGFALVVLVLPDAVAGLGFSPLWFVVATAIPVAALLSPAGRAFIARYCHTDQAPDAGELAIAMGNSLVTWLFGGLHIWLLAFRRSGYCHPCRVLRSRMDRGPSRHDCASRTGGERGDAHRPVIARHAHSRSDNYCPAFACRDDCGGLRGSRYHPYPYTLSSFASSLATPNSGLKSFIAPAGSPERAPVFSAETATAAITASARACGFSGGTVMIVCGYCVASGLITTTIAAFRQCISSQRAAMRPYRRRICPQHPATPAHAILLPAARLGAAHPAATARAACCRHTHPRQQTAFSLRSDMKQPAGGAKLPNKAFISRLFIPQRQKVCEMFTKFSDTVT